MWQHVSASKGHLQAGGILRGKSCFLESYVRPDDWQCRYIRGGCSYVCRLKRGRKTRALWGISWY
jgi:hypothetical protein